MAESRETVLWAWLRDGTAGMPGLHLLRVENRLYAGTPDVEGCLRGSCFWLELKVANRPASPDNPVRAPSLTEDQVRFLELRRQAGGRAYVLVRVVARGAGTNLLLIPGEHARNVLDGASEADLMEMARPLKRARPPDVLRAAAG